MKILLIHNRYYHESGPETYLFNLKKELIANGHEVLNFSLSYEQNKKNENEVFFPSPVGSKKEYSYQNQQLSLNEKIKIVENLFTNKSVKNKLNSLLDEKSVDFAIVLQFWGKLSPTIFKVLEKRKIKTVLRVSDFGLICGKNTFYRDSRICTLCTKNRLYSVHNKCVSGSYIKSLVNSFAQIKFLNDYPSLNIICPSDNTRRQFINSGFNERISKLRLFTPESFNTGKIAKNRTDFSYVGRVSHDKGILI